MMSVVFMMTKNPESVSFEMLVRSGEGHRRELLQTLTSLRVDMGSCMSSEIFEDVAHPDRFVIIQRWPSRGALEEYRHSVGFRTLHGAVQVLGSMEEMRVVGSSDLPSSD